MNLNVMPFSNSYNDQSAVLSAMNFTFSYKGEIGIDNGFKLYIKKGEGTNSSHFFIITPIGVISPRTKAREIYYTIVGIAKNLQISWEGIEIVLDLLDVNGVEKKHLFEWVFIQNKENIKDEIKELSELSLELEKVISIYYNEKFSTLTNSSLNNKQKVEISAYALAENCYDEYSADNIARNFKMMLKNAVLRKKTLKTTLNKV